jgi:hypothetical protein
VAACSILPVLLTGYLGFLVFFLDVHDIAARMEVRHTHNPSSSPTPMGCWGLSSLGAAHCYCACNGAAASMQSHSHTLRTAQCLLSSGHDCLHARYWLAWPTHAVRTVPLPKTLPWHPLAQVVVTLFLALVAVQFVLNTFQPFSAQVSTSSTTTISNCSKTLHALQP